MPGIVMGQYADLQMEAEAALEGRLFRRRRVVRGIRGLLRGRHRPRWIAAGNLLWSLPIGYVGIATAHACGFSYWGPAPAVGAMALWPAYAALTRRTAERLSGEEAFIEHFQDGLAIDDYEAAIEAAADAHFSELHAQWQQSMNSGIRGGSQVGGGADLPTLILLGCATIGTLVVWELLKVSPTILAETILDEPLARSHPGLERRVEIFDGWQESTYGSTGLYFLALAIVTLIFGVTLGLFRPLVP